MTKPIDILELEVLELPAAERARLARLLLASLDDETESAADVQQAWDKEVYRRLEEVRDGNAKLIPASKVMERLRRGPT